MLKNLFDGVLSIYVIISFLFLILGNIARLIYWMKDRSIKKETEMCYYLNFWNNEWGIGCTDKEYRKIASNNKAI